MNHKELSIQILDIAKQQGAQACRVSMARGSSNMLEYRNIQLDKLQQASENKLTIELFVDGRYGVYSTNRMECEELKLFIKDGVAMTRYLAEDPARGLPSPARYCKPAVSALDLHDAEYAKLTTEAKLALVQSVVKEVYGSDSRLLSVSAEFSDAESYEYMTDSNGFEGEEWSTYYNLSAAVSLKDIDDARPEAWWYDLSTRWNSLQHTGIGTTALQRALRKLGQKKVRSGKYAMLVDNLSVGRLLSPMLAAMYGSGLQQKNSFLLNKLNEPVASGKLTVIDDPHIPQAIGARRFDDEGVATVKRAVIEKGLLRTYFINTYYANKMNIEPTISGPSILTFEPGGYNLEQLTALLKKGILVTGFNGGNSNSSTGDFSFGIEGFLIENGRVTQPVAEMNITGNLLTLWKNVLEIGNDARRHSAWRTPSILFDNVDFSGL
jgi:PmbA protein